MPLPELVASPVAVPFTRAAFLLDYADSALFHVLEDTVRLQNAAALGLLPPDAETSSKDGAAGAIAAAEAELENKGADVPVTAAKAQDLQQRTAAGANRTPQAEPGAPAESLAGVQNPGAPGQEASMASVAASSQRGATAVGFKGGGELAVELAPEAGPALPAAVEAHLGSAEELDAVLLQVHHRTGCARVQSACQQGALKGSGGLPWQRQRRRTRRRAFAPASGCLAYDASSVPNLHIVPQAPMSCPTVPHIGPSVLVGASHAGAERGHSGGSCAGHPHWLPNKRRRRAADSAGGPDRRRHAAPG